MELTPNDRDELCRRAVAAMAFAYAPYSNYSVGAAVLTGDGKIHQGANVENASYGLTMCAERVAVGNAVSQGEKKLIAVAIATRDGGSPCGACRQVLAEFSDGSLEVLLVNGNDQSRVELTLDDLLPHRFSLE